MTTAIREKRLGAWALAATAYVLCTVVYFLPLFAAPSHTLPSDLGDPALNTWILWWNSTVTPFTASWWNGPFFYPLPDMLALSETLIGIAPLTTPLQWLGASPVLTYNIVLLLSYPAAALAAHALALRLTGRHDAAFLAGMAFGFAPYRAAQLSHIQMLISWWLPLGLLYLHRFVDEGRRRWAVLAAACWTGAGLATGYYLVYFAVLIGCWICWFARTRRQWAVTMIAFIGAAALIAPLLLAYQHKQSQFGMTRGIGEINAYSADLSGVWAASGRSLAMHWTFLPGAEGEMYPGVVVMAIALAGVIAVWRAGRVGAQATARTRVRRVLLGLSCLAAVLALLSWWTGGFELGPLSLTRPHRTVSFAVWFALAALVLHPRVSDAYRQRSVLGFYVAATAVMLIMALGPFPKIFDYRFMYQAPYAWLMQLPGGEALRVPARFAMLFALCLGQVAALVYARYVPRARAAVLAPVVGLLIAIDGSMPYTEFIPMPPVIEQAALPADVLMLELPVKHHHADMKAMLRAMAHRRPLINGYSGYFPLHYDVIAAQMDERVDPDVMNVLREFGPIVVHVSRDEMVFELFRDIMDTYPDATRLSEGPAGLLYYLPALPARVQAQVSDAEVLPLASVAANTRPDDAALMHDGDVHTRWETLGPQTVGHQVTVQLAETASISRIELDLGRWRFDYPRGLHIEIAPEAGAPGTVVFDGPVAGELVRSFIADPARTVLTITLPAPARGRELRMTANVDHEEMSWSIAEMKVLGARRP